MTLFGFEAFSSSAPVSGGSIKVGAQGKASGSLRGLAMAASAALLFSPVVAQAGAGGGGGGGGITTTTLNPPNLQRGDTYSFDWASTVGGGSAPYTYVVTTVDFPVGVTFNETNGFIEGTPACNIANGSFKPVIQVTDDTNTTASFELLLNMNGSPASTCTINASPTGSATQTVGANYNQTVTTSGGSGGAVTYAVTAGAPACRPVA